MALLIPNMILWSVLLLFMLPGAWATARGKNMHRGDPMRLGVASVCLVFIVGFGRHIIAPEIELLWTLVQVLAFAVGVFVFRLAMAYGRGPKL